MKRTVECFYPGDSSPAISVTGTSCSLDCKHCSRKYLEGMVPARTPSDLLDVADALAERGAAGFLLSGGVDRSGKVGLGDFVPAISEIKSTTDLRINAHVGLLGPGEAASLVGSGIDSFSVDLYGSDDTVLEVLGLGAKATDYFGVYTSLKGAGAPVVAPHICVGVHEGKLRGEFKAIEMLRSSQPRTLILISLIPTKGTSYESVRAPSAEMVASVVRKARQELPDTKIVLGCMRSKRDRSSEAELVEAGLDGIVLPATSTVEKLRAGGYSVRKRALCCSFI